MLLVISKRLKFPCEDDRTDTSFKAPLRMHFSRSKCTVDNQKSVFMYLGNNYCRVPLIIAHV